MTIDEIKAQQELASSIGDRAKPSEALQAQIAMALWEIAAVLREHQTDLEAFVTKRKEIIDRMTKMSAEKAQPTNEV